MESIGFSRIYILQNFLEWNFYSNRKYHYFGLKTFFKIISKPDFGMVWIRSYWIQNSKKGVTIFAKNFHPQYSLNLNQSKSTDYQWNLTDLNSWKEVSVNQSNSTDYFRENQLIWQWKILLHWWINEKANHWFNQWKFD